MERLFLYSIQVGETAPSAGLTLRWTVPFQLHLHSLTLCNTGGGEGINARHQFLPTRMWGLRRGSKFGSEPAEARPSLAMMIINVKNPRTPTRSSMKTRCFQEKDVRFPPVRFLNKQKRKSVKRANTMTFVKWFMTRDKTIKEAPAPQGIIILTWEFEQTSSALVVFGTCRHQSQSVWQSCDRCPECRRSSSVMMLEDNPKR